MSTLSDTIYEIGADVGGDLSVGRGQLGLTAIDSLSADSTLWTDYPERPSRYVLSATGANRTVTLPVVGTTSSTAQPGHTIDIVCPSGSAFSIVVETSATVTLQTVTAGNILTVIANTAPATWTIALDTTDGDDPTLQDVYDNSITKGEAGDIDLNTGNNTNGITITNTGDVIAGDVLTLDGSANYFTVKNITTTSYTPAIQGLGGSATTSGSVAIGDNLTTGVANSMIFGDGTIAAGTTVTDQFEIAFGNGFRQVAGAIAPGTVNTDPNFTRIQGSLSTTNDTPTNITDIAVATTTDTNYKLDVEIIASEDGGSSTSNGMIVLEIVAVNDTGTVTIIGYNRRRIIGSGFDIVAQPSISTTTINIEVTGLAATTIGWLANMSIQEYKWN